MKKIILLYIIFSSALAVGQNRKQITLEDIYTKRIFSSQTVNGLKPMKNGEEYCLLEKDDLNIYDYVSGKLSKTLVTSRNLIPDGKTTPIEMSDYEFSDDESSILFSTEKESIYRYSNISTYYVYNFSSG